jgi:hypothetical protein
MTKTFRLTIDFKAEIKDYIQGIKNKKVEEFTREIIKCFLSDEKMLAEFIKLRIYSRFLYDNDPEAGFEKALALKTGDEIFHNLLPKLSPETAFYLKTICCAEYKIFQYEGEDGTAIDFILEHFSFHVIDVVLIEIGDAANKEEGCLVMKEAEIAVSSHDEARI